MLTDKDQQDLLSRIKELEDITGNFVLAKTGSIEFRNQWEAYLKKYNLNRFPKIA